MVGWVKNETLCGLSEKKAIYNKNQTSNAIRTKLPEVRWWKLVWFSKAIPRHAFILWLLIKNRLTTPKRLMKWDIRVM